MSPPVAVTVRLFPAFRVLPLVVTCSECDREEEDCEPSDALIPIVLLLSLSLQRDGLGGLDTGKRRFCSLKRTQATVTAFLRLLRGGNRVVHRTACAA